jgi:hypothetical protein
MGFMPGRGKQGGEQRRQVLVELESHAADVSTTRSRATYEKTPVNPKPQSQTPSDRPPLAPCLPAALLE